MIKSVRLKGFKGQGRDVELGALTLLSGPNGTGKSSILEGIAYALGGAVPSGRAAEEVGKYFSGDSGHVALTDHDGNWIQRGIEREGKRVTVTSRLETSDTDEDAKEPDTSRWTAQEAVLDLREFLSLSPNRRREFVLKLCGEGGAVEATDLYAAIAKRFAKNVAGHAAGLPTLADPSDLPDEERELMEAFTSNGGVGQVVISHLNAADLSNVSDVLRKIAKVCNEEKNRARRDSNDAAATARELRTELQGVDAVAQSIEARRAEFEAAEKKRLSTHEAHARWNQIETAIVDARRRTEEALTRLNDGEEHLASLPMPGPEPTEDNLEDLGAAVAEHDLELTDAQAIARTLEDVVKEFDEQEKEDAGRWKFEKAFIVELEAHKEMPVGKLVEARGALDNCSLRLSSGQDEEAREIRDRLTALWQAIDEVSESWRARRTELEEKLKAVQAARKSFTDNRAELEDAYQTAKSELEETKLKIRGIKEARSVANCELDQARIANVSKRSAWVAASRKRDSVAAENNSHKKSADAASKEYESALARRFPEPDYDAAVEEYQAAKVRLKDAEQAAGRVKGQQEALAKAERLQVAKVAWKHTEAAVKAAREHYVVDAVRPLRDGLQEILRQAGRQETVYIELENQRGTPTFDIGWVLNDEKRSLSSLSGGESVLLCAALSIVIARQCDGLKVLLIEADPLDEDNLISLLTALHNVEDELDACVVATSTPCSGITGWSVIHFQEEVLA